MRNLHNMMQHAKIYVSAAFVVCPVADATWLWERMLSRRTSSSTVGTRPLSEGRANEPPAAALSASVDQRAGQLAAHIRDWARQRSIVSLRRL